MANATPGSIAAVTPVIGSQASGGKSLPPGGKSAAATADSIPGSAGNALLQNSKSGSATAASTPARANTSAAVSNEAKSAAASRSDPQSLVDQVNKYLNDSGRPDQFRVDPDSAKYIQQVNPATGAVIGEYLVSEFPALARGVGASGLLIDDIA
jgi:hypothetical protein